MKAPGLSAGWKSATAFDIFKQKRDRLIFRGTDFFLFFKFRLPYINQAAVILDLPHWILENIVCT